MQTQPALLLKPSLSYVRKSIILSFIPVFQLTLVCSLPLSSHVFNQCGQLQLMSKHWALLAQDQLIRNLSTSSSKFVICLSSSSKFVICIRSCNIYYSFYSFSINFKPCMKWNFKTKFKPHMKAIHICVFGLFYEIYDSRKRKIGNMV